MTYETLPQNMDNIIILDVSHDMELFSFTTIDI